MCKVFLALLVVAVQSFPYKKYYCNQIVNNVINTDDNEPFLLYSDSYPSTIQKDCTVTFLRTANSSICFYMMYSYYDGKILQNDNQSFSDGNTYTTGEESTAGTTFFRASSLYFPKPATNRWNGFQYFFFPAANRPEGSCPMTNNEPMVINEAFVIAVGWDLSDLLLPKLCKWKLKAPAGFALVVVIQAIALDRGVDVLVFEGSVNGVHTAKNFTSPDPGDLMLYFDNELELTLINSKPRSTPPGINLDITPFKPSAATCSLAFDSQKFRNCSGRFTNMVPYQRYLPNELCRWTVILPKGKDMKVSFLEDDAGNLTGDSLTVITRTGNVTCHKCNSPTVTCQVCEHSKEFNVVGSNVEDTEVAFEWKTDGVFEYNGFMVDYLIQDCSASATSVYRQKYHTVFYATLLYTVWARQWS